jgi:hypothetical protein
MSDTIRTYVRRLISERMHPKKYPLPIKGWIARKYYLMDHFGEPENMGWKFFDSRGELVGFMDHFGSLQDAWDHQVLHEFFGYVGEEVDEKEYFEWLKRFRKSDQLWKNDPVPIARMLYLKLAERKLRKKSGFEPEDDDLEENKNVKINSNLFNPEHEYILEKFPELEGMFVTKEIIDPKYSKFNTWFFYDGDGQLAATLSEPGYLTYHDKHGHARDGEVFIDKNGGPDFKKMATLIWLNRQKPIQVQEAKKKAELMSSIGPFHFPDIGGYSASGPYRGGYDDDEDYVYISITDEKGTEVGHLKSDGTLLYVDAEMSKKHGYPMWDEASNVSFENNENGLRQAVRYVILKRASHSDSKL